MTHRTQRLSLWASLLSLCILMTACDDASNKDVSTQSTTQLKIDEVSKDVSGWPRTLMTSHGPVTLTKQPTRIVSTSVTMTGTLLAIDAPIIGSGATIPNTNISDDQGFFTQWSECASKKGLKVLYQTEHNAEAVIRENPDLILISATGGDSALKLYDQLKDIAPTAVINYGDKSWMQLAKVLGNFIGLEENANILIDTFNQQIDQFKEVATLPPQPTTALVYYRDGTGGNIWTSESAQGQLLTQLGFTLSPIPDSMRGDLSMGKRNDIVIASGERFPDALTGNTLLLFATEPPQEAMVKNNAYLAETPAILNNSIYAVGNDTFRLDYFSSSNMIQRLTNLFKKDKHALTSNP
ncbi:MAG: Fe2+-enterobactin ABC transporter substrate-binding protein [Gammaproteobacteria bacterium]|uniref:Iron complex transport system substrate-binding protein n=1 Tax=Marinomonas polaris DSM 16579 TaxID=1122206 RepID=A0A1M4TIQ4_9GAMM|nr:MULTISPECIES: Fe2+-enterobactin ABC transporter substrate-binding protein [Marinomonas]MBU1295957.1 Fe2+-enterobactin ABC transporter substrate-binding protein [Gammaproteobacteria bacterium]MBU1465506.1 Fe2+-enterobactin ABC transporter substrate-binding protein [Gammaproteobacteria bacterium]MBU2024094.1 Fe2+-enterobactin ABC transporter substrate-binding protein [Gammaproteobacteria bacterium]MBU2236454.1 Fe2+-enterobactin ABC transporter substrate-binding protein [Gammaproteobacteria bac